ncbi:MAG: M56 family metallopeptidase [Planctomycetota bacterium]
MIELLAQQATVSTALLGATLLAWTGAGRASASSRHRLILWGLLATTAVPMLHLLWPARLLPAWPDGTAQLVREALQLSSGAVLVRTVGPTTPSGWAALPTLLVAAAVMGIGWHVLRLAWAAARLARTRRRLDFATADPRLVRRCAHAVGLRRAPPVGVGHDLTPMAAGWIRPWVAVPRTLGEADLARQQSVLLHEMAHLRRRDPAWRWIAALVRALHWWNPLVHVAVAALHREQEDAADDLVLAAGRDPAQYASDLLAVAADHRTNLATTAAAANVRGLERRLERILGRRLRPTDPIGWPKLAIAGLALLLAVPLPPAARAPATGVARPALSGTGVVTAPAGLLVNADGQVVGGRCSADEVFWVYVTDSGAIAFAGDVQFEGDAPRIGAGGYLLLEQRKAHSFDRVEVAADTRGTLAWRQHCAGHEVASAGNAAAWLAAHLPAALTAIPDSTRTRRRKRSAD